MARDDGRLVPLGPGDGWGDVGVGVVDFAHDEGARLDAVFARDDAVEC
jgi:hypothetical protein